MWKPADREAISDMGETVKRSFPLPEGILPRMQLLACGFVKDGDEFKRADDPKWWKQTYQHPLWNPLGTWIDLLERRSAGPPPLFWSEEIASGNPSAISGAIEETRGMLAEIRAAGMLGCAPWFIPKSRGTFPHANLACQLKLGLDKKKDDIKREVEKVVNPVVSPAIPFWVWLALGVIVARELHRR